MIKGISHLAFTAQDMEKSLKFYCDGLGLKHAFNLTAGDLIDADAKGDAQKEMKTAKGEAMSEQQIQAARNKPVIAYLQIAPSQFLELFYKTQNEIKPHESAEASTQSYQHLSLEVDDIEATRKDLAEKGYNPTSEITVGADNTKQLWYADPDGNKIELMEYTKDSWQLTKAVL